MFVPGLWIGDCFIYTNGAWRLNYCVGGEVTTMFHLDRPMYLLGYLAAQSKVYLIDKVSSPNYFNSNCNLVRGLSFCWLMAPYVPAGVPGLPVQGPPHQQGQPSPTCPLNFRPKQFTMT